MSTLCYYGPRRTRIAAAILGGRRPLDFHPVSDKFTGSNCYISINREHWTRALDSDNYYSAYGVTENNFANISIDDDERCRCAQRKCHVIRSFRCKFVGPTNLHQNKKDPLFQTAIPQSVKILFWRSRTWWNHTVTYRSTLLTTHLPLNTAAGKINRSFERDLANSPNPTPSLLTIPNHPFTFLPSAKK